MRHDSESIKFFASNPMRTNIFAQYIGWSEVLTWYLQDMRYFMPNIAYSCFTQPTGGVKMLVNFIFTECFPFNQNR